ncbi:heme biosynthesis HemY N-terminal domain-containing protein [Paraferrimonas sedimenticola]|uniref:Heme biosynthesis protein HemY n=1 Tax=Paraferrimonas sedimenticola TaxID=375674 RepID=A0AA37W282_9GAMM|nr:heme biosynthesis HemY N-terminal domain-containing protein [Paraferrimonas sedimenticola]GLP97482.1 heme biosynthesis protein HemY [Paraferrimonas sedimenticola]
MIRVLAYLLIILAGMMIAPYLIANKGYVLVAVGEWTIESSLLVTALVLVVFYTLLQLLEWLVVGFINTLLQSRYWPERWRRSAARKNTLTGALALAEEDWQVAEDAMAKGAAKGELPALNYLAAARAAQQQGHIETRDKYLALAKAQPNAKNAATVASIRYLLQQGESAQARELLDTLKVDGRAKPSLLSLAKEVYLAQSDWKALRLILPLLRKKQLLDGEQAEALLLKVDLGELSASDNRTLDELRKHWAWMPRVERNKPIIKAEYCRQLAQFELAEAQQLLMKQLKSHQDPHTLAAVAELMHWQDNDKLQTLLNKFHQANPESAELNDCIGRLMLKDRLFKQAKPYWQAAIKAEPTRERYLILADIQENQGEQFAAISSYKHAANLS